METEMNPLEIAKECYDRVTAYLGEHEEEICQAPRGTDFGMLRLLDDVYALVQRANNEHLKGRYEHADELSHIALDKLEVIMDDMIGNIERKNEP